MTTVSNIATRILDENGWQLTDLPKNSSGSTYTATQLEYLIDNAIQYINIELTPEEDGPISVLSGTAGSKSLSGSQAEVFCVKQAVSLMIRAIINKGANVSLADMSISHMTTDPHYTNTKRMLDRCISKLAKTYQQLEVELA